MKNQLNDKNNINQNFNEYLKSQKNKKNEKHLIIIIIDKFCEYIIKNMHNNNENNVSFIRNNMIDFINEIKNNYENWKKIEKNYDELKIIKQNINKEVDIIINNLITLNRKVIENKIEKEKSLINNSINQMNNYINDDNDIQCPLKKNCLLIKNKILKKTESFIFNDINTQTYIYGNFSDIDLSNTILCLKRDLLLKECSIYFSDIYFNDKNFIKLKKYFKYNYENNSKIVCINEIDKFNYPIKIKNYSNNNYAYPHMFVKPYTSFYNTDTFRITHPYFHRELIKKPSFPYILPHYNLLKNIIENNNEKIYFDEECEAIMKQMLYVEIYT